MIYLSDIQDPSEHVRRRSASMWAVKQPKKCTAGRLVYRVTPYGAEFGHKQKTKRMVTLDLIEGTAECVDWYSGLPCQANADFVLETGEEKRPRMCSHVYAVLQLREKQKQSEAA